MRYVVFDLETQNTFNEVGSANPADLDISVGCVYDSESDSYTSATHEELHKLWPVIERAEVLVGYNSNHFDIPLLNKYYPGDLNLIKSIDLLEDIKNAFGKRVRLDLVAQATLGTKKSANGLQAIKWWREGDIASILKYCKKDVEITKQLFEYMLTNKKVFVKEGHKKREVPIETKHWIPGEAHSMTHSLPF